MSLDASTAVGQRADVSHLPYIDLTPVRLRVAKENSEFTAEQLDELEQKYLQFLRQCKTELKVRPDKDVDEYWHAHILHTKQYAEDCQRYFGYFLHHEPDDAFLCNSDGGCGSARD